MQSQITYPEWDHWCSLLRWKFSDWQVLLAGIEPSSDAGQLIQPVEVVIEGQESEPTGVYVAAVCDGPLRLYAERSADIATRGAQAITAGDLDVLEPGDADNVVSLRRDVLVWANQQHIVIPDDLVEIGEADPDWGYYRGVDALAVGGGALSFGRDRGWRTQSYSQLFLGRYCLPRADGRLSNVPRLGTRKHPRRWATSTIYPPEKQPWRLRIVLGRPARPYSLGNGKRYSGSR